MKKLLYIFLFFTCIGCDDFLDVNPKSVVVNDDLFQNDEGFQDAIYGINSSLSVEALYGKKLSFEYTELCAQYFKSSVTNIEGSKLRSLNALQFKDPNVTSKLKAIWGKMYEVVGYVNNVLKNIKNKSEKDLQYYNLYKGESLALRASIHFDLLRLFAIDINSSDSKALNRGIPYVMSYSNSITKFSSVEKVYEYIIKDLKDAEILLEEDVELIEYPRKEGGRYFTDARITHMNLYAVQAMLARVYWQKKEMGNAAIYAQKVIDSGKFPLMIKTSLDTDLASVMSFNETIWGLYNKDFYNITNKGLYNRTDKLFVDQNFRDYYQVDVSYGRDYRLDWFGTDEYSDLCLVKLNNAEAVESQDKYVDSKGYLGINMIRVPEMYYIMAEALLKTDIDRATGYFDAVIKSRGMVGLADRDGGVVLTKAMIMEDRRKEFIGEGQEWFRMKREKGDIKLITSGLTTSTSDATYVWPHPDVEDEMNR